MTWQLNLIEMFESIQNSETIWGKSKDILLAKDGS